MKEDPSLEQSLKEWTELFADPASSLSAFWGPENGEGSAFSPGPYLALWLDYFLVAGDKPVKEKWAALAPDKQIDLGIALLKCYLVQPLYIRLSREEKGPVIKAPLILESQGKFFRVEHGTGTNKKIELLYPLDHLRFWPELFGLYQANFFSSEKVVKTLSPEIILASSSRLEKIRRRAETLNSFFLKGNQKEIPVDKRPEDPVKIKNAPEDISGQNQGDVHPPDKIEPKQPPLMDLDCPPSPLLPPKKRKKKKSSKDQMELFS